MLKSTSTAHSFSPRIPHLVRKVSHSAGRLTGRMSKYVSPQTEILLIFREMKIILDGIGSNFSSIISSVVCFGAGYLIGLILCWDLTLILLATFPLMMLCGIVMTKVN
jgi:ABC-type bacteriocin/lantibiotic exporter with double-glycine peptidase domain